MVTPTRACSVWMKVRGNSASEFYLLQSREQILYKFSCPQIRQVFDRLGL